MKKSFYDYKRIIALDIETSNGNGSGSLDPRTGHVALVQINDGKEIHLIRPSTNEAKNFIRSFTEDDDTLVIAHNSTFDFSFLFNNGIFVNHLFDTMVASQMYYAGLTSPDEATKKLVKFKRAFKEDDGSELLFEEDAIEQYIRYKGTKSTEMSHSFQACLLRELGIFIPKDAQNSDWAREPLSEEQIRYAKNDVLYTIKLAERLWQKLFTENMEKAVMLEMQTLLVTLHLNWTGLLVDREAWSERIKKMNLELAAVHKELTHDIGMHLALENGSQENLFGEITPVQVNLNSSVQLPKILGLPDSQTLTLKKAAEREGASPFIKRILAYKKLQKEVSTYGSGYLSRIGQDGRLRSTFKQTNTATARYASEKPNLQNVPGWLKEMVRARPGYVPVIADFSQVELRIIAYLSQDPDFIESCNSTDLHSANARKIFGIPEEEPVPSDLRKKAKTVSFAIPYGSSAFGMYDKGMFKSVEEAEETIQGFYASFPMVAEFLKTRGDSAVTQAKNQTLLGHIRRYEIPKRPDNFSAKLETVKTLRRALREAEVDTFTLLEKSWKEIVNDEELYPKIKNLIDETGFRYLKEIRNYEAELKAIRREGQNFEIQCSSAEITKQALVDLYEYFRETGHGFFTLTIHDSILFEIKEEYFQYAYPNIISLMEGAGPKVIPGIITPVDVNVGWVVHVPCCSCGKQVETYNMGVNPDYTLYRVDLSSVTCDSCK